MNTTRLARPKIRPLGGTAWVLLTCHEVADTSPPLRHHVVLIGRPMVKKFGRVDYEYRVTYIWLPSAGKLYTVVAITLPRFPD